ncbi:hypothetical protein KJ608_00340, partial [Patescibacteria group bacterium]|nr:hypothetical protein [Patescibacteria group bacterium]
RSMERIDPNDSGSLSSNWCTNDGVTINGLDANGDKILGTPKIQNSCYLESPTPVLTPSPQTLATPTAGQAPTSTPSPTSTLVPTAIPSATDEPEPEMLVTYYYPPQIVVGEGFDVSINVENFAPSVEYYVKWLLGDDAAGSKLYDGRTLGADGESWLAWNAAWSKMPVLTTDSIGAGAITIKVKTDDDVQLGTNYIKVRLRRIDNDKNIDTEIGEIVVLASDGLLVIVPTLTPTPVEERADSTESELVFTFGLPTEVQVDEPFEIPLALCGAEADVEYYVKVLAGLSEGSKMYDGRTLGSDGESWLAWNVLWGKMPVLQIAENGCGTVVITASINVGEGLGAYKVVVRLRRVGSNSNIDSSARVIQVRDEKVDSETTSQVLGAVQVLPRTGKSLEELIISISGSFVNLLKVDFRRINSQASWKR